MIFKYLLKKLLTFFIALFFVATLTFFLMKAIPGDPFMQEQAVPEEIMRSMYVHYGLDKPLKVQYFNYLKGLITWNLGPSFKYEGRTVNDIISEGFPISLTLGLISLMLSLFLGILFGSISSLFRSKWQDHVTMIIAVLGISIPSFILASYLQYIFSMKLSLCPIARWGDFKHAILPAFSLSALPIAFIARLTRTNMVEVLEQDYVLTAKAKGLPMRKVILKHVLKNSLLPVITYIGPLTANILTGSFIIEKIFGIAGLGGWFVNSVSNRDYTVIMGLTVFYSALLMGCVFFVDMIYFLLDPRIQKHYVREESGY